jgi:hypothetical protein
MKLGFTAPLDIREVGYEHWMLLADVIYTAKNGEVITAPKGFLTDLASVPHLARSLIPKIGYWSQAAVIHDLLYRNHREGRNIVYTRKEVDKLFIEASEWKADQYAIKSENRREVLLYTGVRMGGLASWETPKEREDRLVIRDEDWFLDQ